MQVSMYSSLLEGSSCVWQMTVSGPCAFVKLVDSSEFVFSCKILQSILLCIDVQSNGAAHAILYKYSVHMNLFYFIFCFRNRGRSEIICPFPA